MALGGLEAPCSLLFKATLNEPVGSGSPLFGLKYFLIDITEPTYKVASVSIEREHVERRTL